MAEGQEPNAKARFRQLDAQSESVALDILCAELGLQRNELRSLAGFVEVMKKQRAPKPSRSNGAPLHALLAEEVSAELFAAPSAERIMRHVLRLGAFLLDKNRSYGDSALKPLRVFSTSGAAEQIRVRLDDKLSRLFRGRQAGEDVLLDLVGYYILLKIAEEDEVAQAGQGG